MYVLLEHGNLDDEASAALKWAVFGLESIAGKEEASALEELTKTRFTTEFTYGGNCCVDGIEELNAEELKEANHIRGVIVMLYEIAILIVPLFILYLANNGIITPFVMALESFLLMLPKLLHFGVFGDRP